jgi:hypothetical protein
MELSEQLHERYMEWCCNNTDPRSLGELMAEEFSKLRPISADYEQTKLLAKWLLEDQNGKS